MLNSYKFKYEYTNVLGWSSSNNHMLSIIWLILEGMFAHYIVYKTNQHGANDLHKRLHSLILNMSIITTQGHLLAEITVQYNNNTKRIAIVKYFLGHGSDDFH